MKIGIVIVALFLSLGCFGQQERIDSLKKEISLSRPNTKVIISLIKGCRGNTEEAFDELIKSAIEVCTVYNNNDDLAQLYNEWGILFTYKDNSDIANSKYRVSLGHALQAKNYLLASKVLGNLGQSLIFQYKLKPASDTLMLAENIVAYISDPVIVAKQLIQIWGYKAMLFKELGLFEEAIELNQKILGKLSDFPEDYLRDASYNLSNIGSAYQELGLYQKSTKYYHASISTRINDPDSLRNNRVSYLNLAKNFLSEENLDSALFYCSTLFRSLTPDASHWLGYFQIKAQIFLRSGMSDSAFFYVNKSINISKDRSDSGGIYDGYNLLSKVFASKGNFMQAIAVLTENMMFYDQSPLDNLQIFKELSVLYENVGRNKDALFFLKKYDSLNKIHFGDIVAKMTTASEIKYETSLKEATISTQKVELAAKRKQNVWLLIGGSVALIAATGLALLYRRISRQKAQIHNQKQEILHNNRNSLQQLISIFSRQAANESDSGTAQQNQERLMTLNLLNKMLYEQGGTESIPASSYVTELCKLKQIGTGNSVAVNVQATVEKMAASQLKDVGLIINELVTNSIKHAFTGIAAPAIHIRLIQNNKEELELHISDNGNGLPAGFSITSQRQSFGLSYVADLVQQHHGSIETYNHNGANFKITMKLRTHA
jgi:two-component sensor histidine kinase